MKRPEARRLIVTGRNNGLAVGTEGNTVHRLRMPAKLSDHFSVQRIPDSHRIVRTRSHNKLAIRTEERRGQRFRVTTQLCDGLPACPPEPRCAIAATSHDPIAIGTEPYSGDVVLMFTKPELHLAGSNFPDRCRKTPVR